MIEKNFRKTYQRICVEPLISLPGLEKMTPSIITGMACVIGVMILPLLMYGWNLYALLALAVSGYLDTVDGSLARLRGRTSSKGAVYDIVSDRVVEFAIILGLFAVYPEERALPALLMLGSILICVTSFLIVGLFSQNQSEKSFYYSPGLIERAEAFLFFGMMIIFPTLFVPVSYLFCVLVFLTALIRIIQFCKN